MFWNPRYLPLVAMRSAHHYGPAPTWRQASLAAKLVSLSVLAMFAAMAVIIAGPVAVLIGSLIH